MQPVPTYEDLPVVFSAAPQVEIPDPTIDTGYGEGAALPTEHFSWLEYKVTQKIDELATSVLSVLGEMDSYLVSRGVTPSGASVTQFQTALAAQIAGASVASAATCTGNSATATQANNALACSGNSATATKLQTARTIGGVSFDGSENVDLPGVNQPGNQDTTGWSGAIKRIASAGQTVNIQFNKGLLVNTSTGAVSYIGSLNGYTVPASCDLYQLAYVFV